MSSLNKVQIIGRLGQDPEIRHAPSGDANVTISVATSERWKDKQSGEQREKTEWHRVVLWGRLAEIAGQYLKKGSLAYFEGKLETRKWTDKDGIERYTTEIKADQMRLLSGRDDQQGGGQQRQQAPQQRQAAPAQRQAPQQRQQALEDDDIPF